MSDILTFTTNWNNKLQCNAFSTIRLRNDQKYFIGKTFQNIILNPGPKQIDYGQATIVSLIILTLDKLTETMSRIDTGYNRQSTIHIIETMYKNKGINLQTQEFVFVVLAKKFRT